MSDLPTDSKERKNYPLVTGCLQYFPKALAEIARLSKLGNDKHNPGQPLHWSRDKSNDHLDCIGRHLLEAGTMDKTWGSENVRHSTQLAWRALANLEIELENAGGRDHEQDPDAYLQIAEELRKNYTPPVQSDALCLPGYDRRVRETGLCAPSHDSRAGPR